MEARSARSVSGTFRPRTEGRHEPRRARVLDGLFRPAHDPTEEQTEGRAGTAECRPFIARRLSAPSGYRPCGRSFTQQACGHCGGRPPRTVLQAGHGLGPQAFKYAAHGLPIAPRDLDGREQVRRGFR